MEKLKITTALKFLFIFAMIIPCMFVFSACGNNSPQVRSIQATYNGQNYTFDGQTEVVEYSEDLSFVTSDFTLRINYENNTFEDITTGFTFKIFKVEGTTETETNNLLPGEYKLKFTYGNETYELNLTVNPKTLTENDVTSNLQASYPIIINGHIEPQIALQYNGAVLNPRYYTVSYGDNDQIGADEGLVTITFNGLYQGTINFNFDITPAIAQSVTFSDVTTIYDGQDKKSECEYDLTNSPLIGVESISYEFFVGTTQVQHVADAGEYTVRAHFNVGANYADIIDQEFKLTINPFDISNLNLADYGVDNLELPFFNAEYEPEHIVPGVESATQNDLPNFTFTVLMGSGANIDNLNVSDPSRHGEFIINGTGNYTGSLTVPFKIVPASIARCIVQQADAYIYNGSQQTILNVGIYWDTLYNLVEGTDYTIVYTNNVNAGQASFEITGIGNYTSTISGNFTIEPQVVGITYNGGATFEYSGVAISPASQDIVVASEGNAITLVENTDYTLTFDQNAIDLGVYYVEVTITNTNYCFEGNSFIDNTTVVYEIVARNLQPEDLTIDLPTIQGTVWTNDYSIVQNTGLVTITATGEQLAVNYNGSYDNDRAEYVLEITLNDDHYNCTIPNQNITIFTYNNPYFQVFEVNGVALNASQIQSIADQGFELADNVNIVMEAGYSINYKLNNESNTAISLAQTNLSFIAGREFNTVSSEYYNETSIILEITDGAVVKASATININRTTEGEPLFVTMNQLTIGQRSMITTEDGYNYLAFTTNGQNSQYMFIVEKEQFNTTVLAYFRKDTDAIYTEIIYCASLDSENNYFMLYNLLPTTNYVIKFKAVAGTQYVSIEPSAIKFTIVNSQTGDYAEISGAYESVDVVRIPESVYDSATNATYSVTKIARYAFGDADVAGSIQTVIISKKIDTIVTDAFANTTNLKNILYEGNLVDWTNITRQSDCFHSVTQDTVVNLTGESGQYSIDLHGNLTLIP